MSKRKSQSEEYIAGIHAVTALLSKKPEFVLAMWAQNSRHDQRLQLVLDKAQQLGITVQFIERDQLDKKIPGFRHQGVIAAVKAGAMLWSEHDLESIVASAGQQSLFLVLDGVQDPHNLGACLRTANAVGAHAVIAPRDNAVGLTPVVRKVASGAAELTPFIVVTNLSRAIRKMQEQGIWFVGTSDQSSSSLFNVSLNGPLAIVLGAEGKGLRRLTASLCDEMVSIPMQGQVESLNVSVATGVCLYEVLRQRRLY